MLRILCLVVSFAFVAGSQEKITPVQKVIQLLEDMVATGVKEKQAEEIQFTEYAGWCEHTTKVKKEAIKKGNEMIETLQADIQKYESDADSLAKEIAALDVDISTWEGDQKSSQKVRDIERKDYEKTHQDYTESMEALDEGIQTLEKQSGDVGQAEGEGPTPQGGGEAASAALTQLTKAKMIPKQAKRAIAAFLSISAPDDADEDEALKIVAPEATDMLKDSAQDLADASRNHDIEGADKAVAKSRAALLQITNQADLPAGAQRALNSFIERSAEHDSDELSAPEANAYESQSKGVIDMLQHLYDKFFKEREKLEKTEVDNLHGFKMLAQDLKNQLDFARSAREEKKVAKSKALQQAADSNGDLGDTTTTRDDDVKYLADMTATCEQKASAYEQRQKLRAEELVAVDKAIEIMKGGAVSGASEKHLPQLLQKKQGSSFVQLRSNSLSPTQARVAAYLKNKGAKLNSRVLSAIAMRVAVDPFKKVKKMVKDLIVKLMEEANAEADHKGWCDMELATNEKTRTEKSDAVVNLSAEIDELEASVAKLAQDIAALAGQIAELDAAVAKATKIRGEEKAKNEITIKDAVAAQEAVSGAIGVLKDFYAGAETATSLAQTKAKQPEVFDEPYKGMGGENGGVIGMMEVIQADFARLESETKSSESEGAKEYDEFMFDSRVDKAEKEKDHDHKSGKEASQSKALEERKADLVGTQKELDAAVAYYDKLKPDCIATVEPYEERVARRKEEIESLQEALRILQGEEVI